MPEDTQSTAACALPATPPLAVADGEADGTSVADRAVVTLQALEAALAPVIGQDGVRALRRRSLQLASPSLPCLGDADPGEAPGGDLGALRAALSSQTGVAASTAAEGLLQAFWALLTGLIGCQLAERLIGSSRVQLATDRPHRATRGDPMGETSNA